MGIAIGKFETIEDLPYVRFLKGAIQELVSENNLGCYKLTTSSKLGDIISKLWSGGGEIDPVYTEHATSKDCLYK